MNKSASRYVLCLAVLTAFSSCEKVEDKDLLENTGILGRWEITEELTNGVSDLLPRCCEFLDFIPDDNIEDYKGLLTSTSVGLLNSGIFEVDLNNKTILFIDDDNDQFLFNYSVDESLENLTIDFTEDGNNFVQRWVKRE